MQGVKNDVYSFGVVLCELLSSTLAKDWFLNEEDNIATVLSKKMENQALVELLDRRLGFDSNLKIKQVMTATAELAFMCMKCPQELRPNTEQVLEILNGIKPGRIETGSYSTKGMIKPYYVPFLKFSLFSSFYACVCVCVFVNRLRVKGFIYVL